MKTYAVIAEMVDVHSGNRHFPGETFATDDDEQAARLTMAGCLGDARQREFDYEKDGLAVLDLGDASYPALLAIARYEGAEMAKGDRTPKADLLKAIVARRAIVAPDYDRDKLGEIDLATANRAQLDVIVHREGVEGVEPTASDADLITAIKQKRG